MGVLSGSEAASLLQNTSGITLASSVAEVTVSDGQLTGSLKLAMAYDPARVGSRQVPAAYFYSDRKGSWVYLGGRVQQENRTVTVEVSHLTKFAVFARAPVPVFSDMTGHWGADMVSRLAGMEVVAGYPGGTFRPGNNITRAEAAATLVRALKLAPENEQYLTVFKDAGDIPAWAQRVVAAAVKDGLLRGYPEGDGSTTFRANQPISRAELASLAARILEKELGPVAPGALQFADAERIPAWAKESVAVAASRGIIAGYPDRTFRAKNNVTRAEAAAMILRLLDLLYR